MWPAGAILLVVIAVPWVLPILLPLIIGFVWCAAPPSARSSCLAVPAPAAGWLPSGCCRSACAWQLLPGVQGVALASCLSRHACTSR